MKWKLFKSILFLRDYDMLFECINNKVINHCFKIGLLLCEIGS